MESAIPPIYCINLPKSTRRRDRMIQRFSILGLLDRVKFVDAIAKDSRLVDYYGHQAVCWYQDCEYYNGLDQWRKDLGCYASHLKAITKFLEDSISESGCIICEDDILLHNDFIKEFQTIFANVPKDTPLVSLSFMLSGDIQIQYTGIDQTKQNLCQLDPIGTWGGQMYWISTTYAMETLKRFNHPVEDEITSEAIIQNSGGLRSLIPLAIEDTIDSDRAPQDLPYHQKHFSYWGYSNYSKCDPEGLSPLKNCSNNDHWTNYDS